MNKRNLTRSGVAIALVLSLVVGVLIVVYGLGGTKRTTVTAYFDNANGMFSGDEVRILGMPVGEIETIEPQPQRVKVTFWIDAEYPVPADAKAVVLSPTLVTARAIQLVPAYTGGPQMQTGAVIPQNRTAVPVEWDDLREQLQKLSETLQPTKPGGVSSLGGFVNTAADNLRGEGGNIRDSIIKLSQAFSALGDRSGDLFGTIKSLSALVSALQSSTDLMRQLNRNFAATTALLANDPNEVGQAAIDLNLAVTDVTQFVEENRDALGTTADKLASVSSTLVEMEPDIKQLLHILPTIQANFVNIYQPAQGTLSGILAANNFANPIQFICGAIEAASKLNAEQSAKLCVQYLAPIIKNRQFNFPPIGANPFVTASARPNEITYSEDWLRPGNMPAPPQPPMATQSPLPASHQPDGPLAAEAPVPSATTSEPVATDPGQGLTGMMIPTGGDS